MPAQVQIQMFIDTLRGEVETERALRRARAMLKYIPQEGLVPSRVPVREARESARSDRIVSIDCQMRIGCSPRGPISGPPHP